MPTTSPSLLFDRCTGAANSLASRANSKQDCANQSQKLPGSNSHDQLSISDEARNLARRETQERNPVNPSPAASELSQEEKQLVRELQQRDREVKAHEAAHKAAAGSLATGAASYDYQRGPDGQNYAVGGEVSIDTSRGATPEETLRKAQTIKRAALAPANPSAQDRAIAQAATLMIIEAQQEILTTRIEESNAEQQTSSHTNVENPQQSDNEQGDLAGSNHTYEHIRQTNPPVNPINDQRLIDYLA
jgi:hypothetical protein